MQKIYELLFNESSSKKAYESVRDKELDIKSHFDNNYYRNSEAAYFSKETTSQYANFDGYSTYLVDDPIVLPNAFTLSVCFAPRVFEACHGDVATEIVSQLDIVSNEGFSLGYFRHGEIQVKFGNGTFINKIQTKESVKLFENNLIDVTFSEDKEISIYLNSKLIKVEKVDYYVQNSSKIMSIGKSSNPFRIGDYFLGGMFSGLLKYIRIYSNALTSEEIMKKNNNLDDEISVKIVDLDEHFLQFDRHRPKYHAIPPQHWMNEPHAPFYYNGVYHLFYQKNSSGPYFSNLHWGHWTSKDLVFWKNQKTALFPTKKGISPSGVWSGSASFDINNIPTLYFTFANLSKPYNQGVGMAKPTDLLDSNLIDWEMSDVPLIEQNYKQGMKSEFRDPFVWKDSDLEKWYLIIGGGIEDKGPTTWIYTSNDAENWEFKGEFYTADILKKPELGSNWELPVFLPISDNVGNKKYIFIFMSYFQSETEYSPDTYYLIGEFDKENYKFIPDNSNPKLFDYGSFKFSGPSGFVDPKTGDSIVFSILQGNRTEKEEYDAGWAHNAGLPVKVSLEHGELRVEPIERLKVLRDRTIINEKNLSIEQVNKKLFEVRSRMLEIIIKLDKPKKNFRIRLKKDLENKEFTDFIYDGVSSYVAYDRTNNYQNVRNDISGGYIKDRETLDLHIYIDHSAIETYINKQYMISTRVYTEFENSEGIELLGEKNQIIREIKVFKLKSIWDLEDGN